MRRNLRTRTLLSLAMMLALLLALCPTVLAEDAPAVTELSLAANSFPADQCFKYSENNTQICTVQIAAGCSLSGAKALRDSMLAAGYDSFVYGKDGVYYVMCGKFGSLYDALCYSESIHTDPDRKGAFVTNAWLPWDAIVKFENTFYKAVTISQDSRAMETGWEQPSGAYLRADASDTVEVYTVQLCKGTSFVSSEKCRDAVSAAGYPAFVYKEDMIYKTMSGMFENRDEAKAYCWTLVEDAGIPGVVKTALVPAEEAESFLAQWNG